MTQQLRTLLPLIALLPITLHAQVLAGNTTGLAHTAVGIVLAPTYAPLLVSIDTVSIDLPGDGTLDLRLGSANYHSVDANGSWNHCTLLNTGIEVAVSVPGGDVAERLDILEPVDASLNWRAFDGGGSNTLALVSLFSNFGGQWDTIGGDQWLLNDTSWGYLGVRVVDPFDTLYGWVNLVSYVSQDSAWLQIDDLAIENGTTGITEGNTPPEVRAVLAQDGNLRVNGGSGGVLNLTILDLSGHTIQQVSATAPIIASMASMARGGYLLYVREEERSYAFKLMW